MLTRKIFVTIMSIVYLTIQMDSSDACSSSNSSSLWVKDHDTGLHYPASFDIHNRYHPQSCAHVCFALLKLYCRTKKKEITSDDCAKHGILFYKVTEEDPEIRNENDPISWLDKFFDNFPLNPGNIKLPKEFCVIKEISSENEDDSESTSDEEENRQLMDTIQTPMENLRLEDAENKPIIDTIQTPMENLRLEDAENKPIDPICLAELQAYSEQLQSLWSRNPHFVGDVNYQSRLEIARFALRQRVTLGMTNESFEKRYLEHISQAVSSSDPAYNPYNYCEQYPGSAEWLTVSYFLHRHLRLRIK